VPALVPGRMSVVRVQDTTRPGATGTTRVHDAGLRLHEAWEDICCCLPRVPWQWAGDRGGRPRRLRGALPRPWAQGDARHMPRRGPPARAARLERSACHRLPPQYFYIIMIVSQPVRSEGFSQFESVSHLLHIAFCVAMRFTIPAVIRAPCDVESTPPAEAA
jgi:hypothetical protein